MLTIESQCIPGLTTEAKELQEKLANREKADDASKTTSKSRKKRATADGSRAPTFKRELANAKASHWRLVEVINLSEADANKAQTDTQDSQTRLIEVEQETKLAREDLDKVREQFAGSAEAAEKVLRQLMEMSSRAQALEVEVKSLKSKMNGDANTRHEATSFASKKGRGAKLLEPRNGLLLDELDFLKRKESAWCNKELVSRKLADVKGEVNNLVDGLCRGTFDSYANIRHNVDQMLLAAGRRLKKLIDCEAQELQQRVHAALCNAAGDVQESFVGAPEVVNRSVN